MTGAMASLFLATTVATASASRLLRADSAHPVQKVIDLLEDLQARVVKEGQDEEHLYTEFAYWCKSSKATLGKAIEEETAKIDELQDSIAAKKEEEKALQRQIGELEKVMGELDIADGDAESLRGKENNVYNKVEGELTTTINAIQSAIDALEQAKTDTSGLLLAQHRVRGVLALVGLAVNEWQAGALREFAERPAASFMETGAPAPAPPLPAMPERPDFMAAEDRDAHVQRYQFKSGSVIELLKSLKQKFEDDHLASVKAETNAVNAYNLAKAARGDERAAVDKAKGTKGGELTDVQGALSDSQGELDGLQGDLQADSALQAETEKKCSTKETQWAERQKARALELEAMKKAVEILADNAKLRTEPPSNPVPPPSPLEDPQATGLNFLQLASAPGNPVPVAVAAKTRAVQILRQKASQLHSKALGRLAEEISSRVAGPFDDVNNMIDKMIYHLQDEQMDEDKHKAWCDLELNKTDESIATKEEKLEVLQAKIDKADATILELANAITEHNVMIEKIDAHMKESIEIRQVGKKENQLAIDDAQKAQAAIANAIAVLEAHYKESGMIPKEPYELAQTGERAPVTLGDEPSTWTASYTGVTDPTSEDGSGVVAVLKTLSASFSKMEADTRVQEETDQTFYEEEMKECDIDKARRVKDVELKTAEKKRQAEKAASLTESKRHVQSEHEATEQYLSDLQKACVQGGSTYEDRKAARAQEIQALREAKDILQDAFKKGPNQTSLIESAHPQAPRFLRQKQ